ncbi:MAG: copper-binding protein, partial [Terracidiphilus sp.]
MRTVLAGCLFVLAALAGCHSNSTSGSHGTADSSPTVYHLRGKVVSTDTAHGIVVVDHEAIPGFMDAMTMPYQLKDPTIASELHPGDTITADVLVTKSSEETVELDHIVVIAQAKPDYKP